MAAPETILGVERLVGGYGATTILNGASFTARRGAITTLIGPNGAGKSTVFKAIFGLLRLREGRVVFAGEDVTGRTPAELLARGMAYVPQGRNLFPELSVAENLELGGASLRSLSLTRERMETVMARFPALARRARAQASTLSGGEQKQLEIGRALLLEPKLLLIDEPSIGLSPKLVDEVFELLVRLRDEGVTILMVEQNAKKALARSDDAVVLQQGTVVLTGPARAVLDRPDIGELFLGGALRAAG